MPTHSASLPTELQPFSENLVQASTRALTLRTYDWAEAHGVLRLAPPRRAGMLVVVASVYAELCAPTDPPPMSVDRAARFTLLFFCIDDAASDDLVRLLDAPDLAAEWSIGPLTSALTTWREEIALSLAPPALQRSFADVFRAYLVARRNEPRSVPDLETHWDVRRKTIFMDPYVCQWVVSLGIAADDHAPFGFEAAYAIAKDIVLLSNDLGSIDRDRPGGESPDDLNLVVAIAAKEGWSLDHAVDELVARHNQMVRDYRRALDAARRAAGTADADRYADLLTGVVDGNLGSLHALRFRYRNVDRVLARLEWVVAR